MALRRLVPGGRRGRAVGETVSIGKNGHIFVSRTLAEQMEIDESKAVEVFFDDEKNELVLHFVDRGQRSRTDLMRDGLFAVTKQGRNIQVSGKGVLGALGLRPPERATSVPARVEERSLPNAGRDTVIVADLRPLAAGESRQDSSEPSD